MNPQLIRGRFQIIKKIGEGGVAQIYLAEDRLTKRKVALKIALADEPIYIDALKREYKYASIHRHPTIVSPYSLLYDNNIPIIVMPFIDGQSLSDFISQAAANNDNKNTDEVFRSILSQMLEVAAFIHYSGYIYGDFKPDNFMIRNNPESQNIYPSLALFDFNLVSKIGENPFKSGTIEYVAPEVLTGRNPVASSDLYSIGITMYELITGNLPYSSNEYSSLIKEITEVPHFDMSNIPPQFRDGLTSLLSLDPGQRPLNARDASRIFGLGDEFDNIVNERIDYYFSSGIPPFAKTLQNGFNDSLKSGNGKIFILQGLDFNSAASEYLAVESELSNHEIERIPCSYTNDEIAGIFDNISENIQKDRNNRPIMFIDNLNTLDSNNISKLRALLREPSLLPVVSANLRSKLSDLPYTVIDPLAGQSSSSLGKAILDSYLKLDSTSLQTEALTESCGSDPILIKIYLKDNIRNDKYDIFLKEGNLDQNLCPESLIEINNIIGRKAGILDDSQKLLLARLSAWNGTIPMILLTDFSDTDHDILDSLIQLGYLARNKESLHFSSGYSRDYFYQSLSDNNRKAIHRSWAKASEIYLDSEDDKIESCAYHWGEADDPQKSYDSNLHAARFFFNKGALSKARKSAEKLLSLLKENIGSPIDSLMIFADIAKQEGDYQPARAKYLELLAILHHEKKIDIKAETFKDMGDLYRSLKKSSKALYYTRKALALYTKLNNIQQIANCHNNIGLAFWVDEQYSKALESFMLALKINIDLKNYKESAKIHSNIAIIKDISGATSEVVDQFETALKYSQMASDPWLEALISNNLGFFHQKIGEYKSAIPYIEYSLQLSRKIGYTENTLNCLSNLGLCKLKTGELFSAIQHHQDCSEMAETFGNRFLVADSTRHIAEASLLMGNYLLADKALRSIEETKIFRDNIQLKMDTEILRCQWYYATGNYKSSSDTVNRVISEANRIGNPGMKLEAELILASIILENEPQTIFELLKTILNESNRLGYGELGDKAGLLAAQAYLKSNDFFNAEGWIEKILSNSKITRKNYLEARSIFGYLKYLLNKFDEAIEILIENESSSAGSGYLPSALNAALMQIEIFIACGKISRTRESLNRAKAYAEKMLSTLPDDVSLKFYLNSKALVYLKKAEATVGDKELIQI